MPIDSAAAVTALLLGLAGAGHCLGMCGGIAAALNLGGARSGGVTAAYHGGRLLSYTLLGAALGFAAGVVDILAWTIGLRYLAGILMIAMGLSIANWWQGVRMLENMGAVLWRPVQRISGRLLPVRHWRSSLLLGLCWGLMPCGLIYSSLAWAATTQSPAGAALLMCLFGIGTLPAMVTTSLGADRLQQFLRSTSWRRVIGVLLICGGLWTLYITAQHADHLTPSPMTDLTSPTSTHHHH